jgi:hypothetical protein
MENIMRYHSEELTFPNGWEVKAAPDSPEKFHVHAKPVTNFGDGHEVDCYLHDDGTWHTEAGEGSYFNSKEEAEIAIQVVFNGGD